MLLKTILKVVEVEYIYKYILPKKFKALVEPVSSNIRIFGEILSNNFVFLGLLSILIFIKLRYMSRDTPVTPYTRPPVSTDLATRDQLRDCRNLQ